MQQETNNLMPPYYPAYAMLTYDGFTLTRQEWSDRTGIPVGTIIFRKKSGWTNERTLTTPVQARKSSKKGSSNGVP